MCFSVFIGAWGLGFRVQGVLIEGLGVLDLVFSVGGASEVFWN